jgi:hypothetical protein
MVRASKIGKTTIAALGETELMGEAFPRSDDSAISKL